MNTCEHGTPVDEDCPKCRAILFASRTLKRYDYKLDSKGWDRYFATMEEDDLGDYVRFEDAQAEIRRLLNIIKGCPVCSELERNINTKPKDRP